MGAGRAGPRTGLKTLQQFIRGVQLGCCVLILSIFSYFLATLGSNAFETPVWVRAVEGIAGVGALYSGVALLLLCCVPGHPLVSFVLIVLDVAFWAAFIYVASANRGGAGSCEGTVDTPFGSGEADKSVGGDRGGSNLPNFRSACRLETACFSMSLIAIFFFLFSLIAELYLGRQRHRERHHILTPADEYAPAGSEPNAPATPATSRSGGGGFFGFLRRATTRRSLFRRPVHPNDPNYLPAHTNPSEVRETYTTDLTAVAPDDDLAVHSYAGAEYAAVSSNHLGYGNTRPAPLAARNSWDRDYWSAQEPRADANAVSPPTPSTARFPAGNYRYDDGVYDVRDRH